MYPWEMTAGLQPSLGAPHGPEGAAAPGDLVDADRLERAQHGGRHHVRPEARQHQPQAPPDTWQGFVRIRWGLSGVFRSCRVLKTGGPGPSHMVLILNRFDLWQTTGMPCAEQYG